MNFPVIDPVATGSRIDALRRSNGFSVADLKEHFGFSTTNAIYKWLHGYTLPSIDNFLALSVLFNVPINDMIAYK